MNLELLNEIDSFVWGPPLLVLLVGTGVFLSLRLGFLQVARLPKALGLIFKAKSQGEGDTSSFRALCTALAATIGTGNIVGVATAVKAGGPGALFWMWVAAFFGMATKYAEGLLAVKYRGVDEHGEIAGGPMFYIENGMGRQWKPLAVFFAAAGVLVAFHRRYYKTIYRFESHVYGCGSHAGGCRGNHRRSAVHCFRCQQNRSGNGCDLFCCDGRLSAHVH